MRGSAPRAPRQHVRHQEWPSAFLSKRHVLKACQSVCVVGGKSPLAAESRRRSDPLLSSYSLAWDPEQKLLLPLPHTKRKTKVNFPPPTQIFLAGVAGLHAANPGERGLVRAAFMTSPSAGGGAQPAGTKLPTQTRPPPALTSPRGGWEAGSWGLKPSDPPQESSRSQGT